MPTELEELVGFLSHGNSQIRQIAVENLVPYSLTQPFIFKTNQFLPIRDLTLLVRDYKQIAQNAIIILINLSTDQQILELLISNQEFLNTLLSRLLGPNEPIANEISMLLANLGKHNKFISILSTKQSTSNTLKSTENCVNKLLDLFVKGPDGNFNLNANYDHLSYLFADLAKHQEGRSHFLTRQGYDEVIPLCKIVIFTSHKSLVRRLGVAMTIKNICFETSQHKLMLEDNETGVGILPYLLLPLMGGEEYDADDSEGMLEECQLLPANKQRESDPEILKTHLESLMLLSVTREVRDIFRKIRVYPIIRELHLAVSNEEVRDLCERLVQVLMRDEESESTNTDVHSLETSVNNSGEKNAKQKRLKIDEIGCNAHSLKEEVESDDDDDDEKLVEV